MIISICLQQIFDLIYNELINNSFNIRNIKKIIINKNTYLRKKTFLITIFSRQYGKKMFNIQLFHLFIFF